ncbi:MAG: tRNA pseudouridine(13) synthase TruD [Nanoarchaeota archaeon]|nr:tRNA pseudouridine(13) synthase TruD [Nanoarchaeota archaeon]
MYQIKQIYEDFQVEEIPKHELTSGPYLYFWLEKQGLNTSEAIRLLAKALNISFKKFGYAGNKDKRAITKQVCSVYNAKKEKLEKIKLNNIKIKIIGPGHKPISLGDLKGNKFIITIRNLTQKQIKKIQPIKKILNLFDEQRFSTDNIEIGKSIVKGNFKQAVKLLLKNNLVKNKIKKHLQNKPHDYVNAVKLVEKKLLMLFIHAYQSYIWNESVKKITPKPKSVPIVGFGTEVKNKIIKQILKKENVTPRDFIIKQIPEISAEGIDRNVYAQVKNFKILRSKASGMPEGNPPSIKEKSKDKITISFQLPKGSYATRVIKTLLPS